MMQLLLIETSTDGDAERTAASPRRFGGARRGACRARLAAAGARGDAAVSRESSASFEISVVSDGTLRRARSLSCFRTRRRPKRRRCSPRTACRRKARRAQTNVDAGQYRQRARADRCRLGAEIPADRRQAVGKSRSRRHRPEENHQGRVHPRPCRSSLGRDRRFRRCRALSRMRAMSIAAAEWDFWTRSRHAVARAGLAARAWRSAPRASSNRSKARSNAARPATPSRRA